MSHRTGSGGMRVAIRRPCRRQRPRVGSLPELSSFSCLAAPILFPPCPQAAFASTVKILARALPPFQTLQKFPGGPRIPPGPRCGLPFFALFFDLDFVSLFGPPFCRKTKKHTRIYIKNGEGQVAKMMPKSLLLTPKNWNRGGF